MPGAVQAADGDITAPIPCPEALPMADAVDGMEGIGFTVERGTTGEFCTRGYSVMQGYWNDSARTAEAIDAEGWMHTGDLATIDKDGWCRIVGRLKDMLISGGENIYCAEVEAAVKEYLATPKQSTDAMFDYLFANPPRYIEAQKAIARRYAGTGKPSH